MKNFYINIYKYEHKNILYDKCYKKKRQNNMIKKNM